MRSLSKIAYIFSLVLVISSVAGAIPWPVGTSGPDSLNSYTLMTTYGEQNNNWDEVGPNVQINFHTGIDISYEDIGTENIWCVEDGVYTYCNSFLDPDQVIWEWIAVVSQSSSSDEGWCYCHVDEYSGSPNTMHYVEQQPFNTVPATYNDLLGVMTNRPDKHLHFARTEPLVPFGYPGIDNPLDHLVPATLVSAGYRWVVNFSAIKPTFFLEDHDALD